MDLKTFQREKKEQTSKNRKMDDDLRKKAESYAGKSDGEMLGEIADAVKRERADGTFSDEKLNQFVNSVSPMLNEEQRARLAQAIKMIKGN